MSRDRADAYDSPFFHLTFPKFSQTCQNCNQVYKSPLSRCATCLVVHYCSKECQAQHWSVHKPLCKEVKRTLAVYKKEEQKLMYPINYFEDPDYKYRFSGLVETRGFCKSIPARMEACEKIGTASALHLCVDLAMKYFYHCRSDNLGLRRLVPSFFIKLGMDQQAHDFIKWHAEFPDSKYDWGNPALPYLSYWGTNPSLTIKYSGRFPDCYHVLADFLTKVRIFADKTALNVLFISSLCPSSQASLGAMCRFDRLIWDNIGSFLTEKYPNSKITLAEMQDNLHHLLNLLDAKDSYVCRALLYPDPLLSQPKPLYDHPYYVVRQYAQVLEIVPAAKNFIRDHCIKKYGHQSLTNYAAAIDKPKGVVFLKTSSF